MHDLLDEAFGCLGLLAVLVAVTFVMTCTGEVVQGRRAFDATTNCEKERAIARRKLLSTHVVCIPENKRQDTTTVRLDVRGSR